MVIGASFVEQCNFFVKKNPKKHIQTKGNAKFTNYENIFLVRCLAWMQKVYCIDQQDFRNLRCHYNQFQSISTYNKCV